MLVHRKFSQCVFNIQQPLLFYHYCTLCLLSNPSTVTESGDHRGCGRKLWWTVGALKSSYPQCSFPIFALYYMYFFLRVFYFLPCLILGVPVRGCLGGYTRPWGPCFLFFVAVLSGTCVFSNNTTIGEKLCNSGTKKWKCWGARKPVPPVPPVPPSGVLWSKSHFFWLTYIWPCCYFLKIFFVKKL